MPEHHVRHPAPLNQFYRLDYDDATHKYRKTTRWNTAHDSVNCMATEGAVAHDAHTNGVETSTPPQIRSHQGDQSGGIGVDDINVAWYNLWRDTLLTPDDFNWADVIAAVRARRHVAVGVDYRAMPDKYKLQLPGNFDHGIGIDDIRDSDQWLYLYDSLGTNPRWVPQSAVRPAAEALARRVRGTSSKLFVGLSRIRPSIVVASSWRAVLHPTSPATRLDYFSYHFEKNSKGILIIAPPPAGRTLEHTKGFSADCTGPFTLAWPAHKPPINVAMVRLTTSQQAGLNVQAKFARPK